MLQCVILIISSHSFMRVAFSGGVSAKMGLDATKPLDAKEMKFKRIRVPGEDSVDLDNAISTTAGSNWREIV